VTTIKSSNITKQQPTSSNMSSKMQHCTTKQTDLKHVSNNQLNNTSLKHTMATGGTHIQTSNKQIINSKQPPTSSKRTMVVSTSQKVVNLSVSL